MVTLTKTVDLNKMRQVDALTGMAFTTEQEAHRFVIEAVRGVTPEALTGSVTGRFMRPDGETVQLTPSYCAIEDGKAAVTLPGNCYLYSGYFKLVVFNVQSADPDDDNAERTVIYAAVGYIVGTENGALVDPENIINVDTVQEMVGELQDAIEDAQEQATSSVQFTEQSLTEAQKTQARTNVGAASQAQADGLGTALKDITGSERLAGWVGNRKYVDLSKTAIDLTSPYTTMTSADVRCMIVPAEEGDLFTITATGGSKSRAYGFLDSEGNVLSKKAAANATLTEEVVEAPEDAAWLVVNDLSFLEDVYTGVLVKKLVPEMDGLKEDVAELQGSVEDQADEIAEIRTEVDGKSYVLAEADRVAEKVRGVQNAGTLTFVAVSDMHFSVDSADVRTALEDMRDGVKAVAAQVHIDFYASFGDVIYRLQSDGNYEKGKAEAVGAVKILNDCFGIAPQIRMVGNHDPNAEQSPYYFPPVMMNAFSGIYSNMIVKNTAAAEQGYGYCDFEKQKIRLIVLNTSAYSDSTIQKGLTQYSLGATQAEWLGGALDISDKDGCENWQIVILAHIALDQTETSSSSPVKSGILSLYTTIFDAYIRGTSWSASGKGYDYAGKNAAKLAVYINGHQHAYIARNMNLYDSSKVLQYPMALADLYIPNALPARDYPSMDGETYTKTSGTAESTAFDVITLDPAAKVVYAHHYGAGIDIVLHYEPTTESALTTALASPTWATNDNAIATVSGGTVTPVAAGHTMVWAKSEADNAIEVWNYQAVV